MGFGVAPDPEQRFFWSNFILIVSKRAPTCYDYERISHEFANFVFVDF